jgi:hypothetical protein
MCETGCTACVSYDYVVELRGEIVLAVKGMSQGEISRLFGFCVSAILEDVRWCGRHVNTTEACDAFPSYKRTITLSK